MQTPTFFPAPLSVSLPDWLPDVVTPGMILASDDARIELAIKLSELQVKHRSGGPFGAIVCDLDCGAVVGVGVNRVVPNNASIAHAEVVAWSCAQQYYNTFDLAAEHLPPLGLYSSAQPCVSCWGGMFWTGLSKLVCAATKEDVETLAGFNEGPIPDDWAQSLQEVGVKVLQGLKREQAKAALKAYAAHGQVYNPST